MIKLTVVNKIDTINANGGVGVSGANLTINDENTIVTSKSINLSSETIEDINDTTFLVGSLQNPVSGTLTLGAIDFTATISTVNLSELSPQLQNQSGNINFYTAGHVVFEDNAFGVTEQVVINTKGPQLFNVDDGLKVHQEGQIVAQQINVNPQGFLNFASDDNLETKVLGENLEENFTDFCEL